VTDRKETKYIYIYIYIRLVNESGERKSAGVERPVIN